MIAKDPTPSTPDPSDSRTSAAEADRHQQVAELRVAIRTRLTGEQCWLARLGERDAHGIGVDRGEPVEHVLRIESDREVIAREFGLDDLLGLSLVTGACLQDELTGTESKAHGGVALSDKRDALDGLGQETY